MAFDAGMMCVVVREINARARDAKVEKIQQPQKDEIVLTLHSAAARENLRLAINAGANNPKIGFTDLQKENPASAPMLCMLLRKQLGGAKLVEARQIGFDRVAELEFACRDEMGFAVTRLLIVEIMGKYSNLMLTDGDRKILAALKQIDFSTSRLRQVLPGMTYELPPAQDKRDLFTLSEEELSALLASKESGTLLHKFLLNTFAGLSPLVARELACRAAGSTEATVGEVMTSTLFAEITAFRDRFAAGDFTPTVLYDAEKRPVEFCFFPIFQYGNAVTTETFATFGELTDAYFGKRDLAEKIKQRGQDISKLISNATARLEKKLDIQRSELSDCAEGETYKLYGDLLTASLYAVRRGDGEAVLPNYFSESGESVRIPLDTRLTPAQNAQRYYKKYAKSKTARIMLSEQIAAAENELAYLSTVSHGLSAAETESDLAELRSELAKAGYASRMHTAKTQKLAPSKPMEFRTSGGWTVLCGKNNLQNDRLTFHTAEKNDLWFHVKGAPGSHVILLCGGEEPDSRDYTEAATVAATYSSVGERGQIPVDYTRVKNVKKPPAAKPGYVTYSTNYTAYVAADEALCDRLRTNGK